MKKADERVARLWSGRFKYAFGNNRSKEAHRVDNRLSIYARKTIQSCKEDSRIENFMLILSQLSELHAPNTNYAKVTDRK